VEARIALALAAWDFTSFKDIELEVLMKPEVA